ncbi:protein D3-like [Oppia nitens]|uniref:protein D3-like n=1 Tax=Oppia nitens TaxID=1686743 RepID=UPI0023DB0B05|nr:protein D3-like [Oppia nitens]
MFIPFLNGLVCLLVYQQKSGIIPDIIDNCPVNTVQITYNNSKSVEFGNELTPTQVSDEPVVHWPAKRNALYTLVMVDPDAPSRQSPELRSFKHWEIINIPGDNVRSGQTVAEYWGSAPPKDTGKHRYVFLVYEQHCRINGVKRDDSEESRGHFNVRQLAANYTLGAPVAGNYFLAQFDGSY